MCAVEWESSYFHKDKKSHNATEEKTDLIPQQVSLNASAVFPSEVQCSSVGGDGAGGAECSSLWEADLQTGREASARFPLSQLE